MAGEMLPTFPAGLELLGRCDLSACAQSFMFARFTPNGRRNAAHVFSGTMLVRKVGAVGKC